MFDIPRHKRSETHQISPSSSKGFSLSPTNAIPRSRIIRDIQTIRKVSSRGTLLSPKVAWSEEKPKAIRITKSRSNRPSPESNVRSRKLPRLLIPDQLLIEEQKKLPFTPSASIIAEAKSKPPSAKKRTASMITPPMSPTYTNSVINVVTRCAYKTRAGSMLGRPKKYNQDAFIIQPLLQGIKGQYLFAVCDGHGVLGHDVSGYIKEKLPITVEQGMPENESPLNAYSQALANGIVNVDKLVQDSTINAEFSGSTLVSLLIRGSSVICGNVGDSRAVLAERNENMWRAIDLSRDHKPDLPDEGTRIIKANGRIEPYFDDNGQPLGPYRVWLQDQQIPGLAMSRSIGDFVAKSVGVSAEPEMLIKQLEPKDKFIILASDGIWEFISSQEAVDMVKESWETGKTEACCDKLVKEAVMRWQKEDDSIDDITVIVIFLNVLN
ncbi:unnamed protein product [Blepharisma stoltei]|uniref:PPM-type phosphatase domain-containing protein n=1 Tax=Blepharisma stoltei TaxID=1481888 RepID=A0AAU9IPP1_9CILI|nr:unnamed protein product [Blepharisma stoltei]